MPVAFTEGFLKAYLSIDRVVEDDDGRIKIIPKAGASIEDMIRDVDEITAQVDPGAVFNPVVRAKLDAVHETSSKAMKWDLNTLSRMDDAQLMDVLREMQAESEARDRRGAGAERRGHRLRARQARHHPPQRAPVPGAAGRREGPAQRPLADAGAAGDAARRRDATVHPALPCRLRALPAAVTLAPASRLRVG